MFRLFVSISCPFLSNKSPLNSSLSILCWSMGWEAAGHRNFAHPTLEAGRGKGRRIALFQLHSGELWCPRRVWWVRTSLQPLQQCGLEQLTYSLSFSFLICNMGMKYVHLWDLTRPMQGARV